MIVYNGQGKGGCRTFVYRNLNVFCVGIYLKIEDFEGGGVSYIQVDLVIVGIKVLVEWCSFPAADGILWDFWYLKIDHTETRLYALYKDPLPNGI